MAFAETQKLLVKLDLEGNLQSKLGSAARAIQGFDRATSNTQRSLSKFGRNIEKGVVVGTAAVIGGLTGVVKAAADYESAFAGVRKTVNATEPQLQQLSAQFRELSKQIPISASELARLGEAGGALGVPTENLKEFVRVTALLGVTTNLTADEAADSLGVLGNVLHLTAKEYSQFASSLVALGNAGASTEKDIVSIAERAGAAGNLIGVSTQQILGFSSAVASLGIESEAGGTAIQKFFIDTAKFTAAGGDELKILAKVAGTTGKAFQKAFQDDAGKALQTFLAGLGKLPQAKQLKVLEDLGFNDARITRTLLGLANNTKLVSDQMKVANDAFAANTALTKEAEQRFNTFDSQLQITKNTLTDMAITIGSKLLPKITPLLKRLNEFVGSHQADIARFGDQLAAGFEKFADALQKVDWKPFIDGLKLSGEIAKTVITAFRSLPEDLQKLVIAGFALNKVTGGLGTSIVKDIGGALLGNLAQRGSSPANPLFVKEIGLPGGIPGGGGGGIVGTLLKNVLKFTLVGIAADAAVQLAGVLGNVQAENRQLSDSIAASVAKEIQENNPEALVKSQAALTTAINALTDNGRNRGEMAAPSQELINLRKQLALVNAALAARVAADQALSRQQEIRENRGIAAIEALAGKQKDDRDIVRATLSVIENEFKNVANTLNKSGSKSEIKNAIAEALKLIGAKRGDAKNTENVLAGLKAALKRTHDPELQRELKSAIAKVQHVLPGRQFAAKQLAKADQILRSNEKSNTKIQQLQAIERALKDRGLPHAADRIRAKVDQAKREQVYATRAATQAIKDKDLSVRVNNAITNNITVRSIINGTTLVSSYGHTLSTKGGFVAS